MADKQPDPPMYLIPEPVLRGVLDYLMSRPYREVHEGVAALQSLRLAPTQEEPSR